LKLLTRRGVSRAVGAFMDSPASRRIIKPFVHKTNIEMGDFEDRKFLSYNDFFTRRLRPGARTLDTNAGSLIAPCDAKLSAYQIGNGSSFKIKGSYYTVSDLLSGDNIAKEFAGGVCLIFRLTVDDYHRYCYFDNSKQFSTTFIKGELHTVKPIALEKYNIYKRNCREYTVLETENFGKAVQVEVGAMMVGRIVNRKGNISVRRGQEKGKFEFGGSTIVVLLKKDAAKIDAEIIENTKNGLETVVKIGEKIGVKAGL
jgi:phosphatidylserine decarboxylase